MYHLYLRSDYKLSLIFSVLVNNDVTLSKVKAQLVTYVLLTTVLSDQARKQRMLE